MPQYKAPLRDINFVLKNVLNANEHFASLAGREEVSEDLLDAILSEGAKFSENVLSPLNQVGDQEGCVWSEDGVKTPTGFKEAYQQFAEGGWPSMTADARFGGQGLPFTLSCNVLENLGTANMAFNLLPMLSVGAIESLEHHGSPELQQKYLPKLVSGEHLGALAMSETGAGSDVVSMSLRAEAKGGHYVLNGGKFWITNGPSADVLVVYAKTEPEAAAHGITAFIIEKDFAGFRCAQKLDKLGHRGSETGELVFEDCAVPAENILGSLNGGVGVLMSGLDFERAVLAAWPLGIMQACLDTVLPYVHQRTQFGEPIGTFQLIQGKLADMYTRLSATRAYVYAVNQACDRGETTRKDAAAAILFAAENATQCALDAIQLMGGNGYVNDNPVGRYLRDAKLAEIGAGTSEIRRMLIGRELFSEVN